MATIDRNSDGSCTVKLTEPVTVGGEILSRVTIPALKGKHMMKAPFLGANIPIGQLVEFAGLIVMPAGAVEEMSIQDAMLIASEVATMLGKSST
jgi:hypothetical protein